MTRIDRTTRASGRLDEQAAGLGLLISLLGLSGCLGFQERPSIPPEAERHRYLSLDGAQIFVEELGPSRGEPVLLIHGFGATSRSYERLAPTLAARYRVLLVDLPGHGRSDKLPGDYTLPGLADKLFRVLDRRGVDRVHLVGHSWGTAITLTMAQARPKRVRSITLVGPLAFERQLAPFLVWARAPGLGEFLFAALWDQRMDDRLTFSFYDPGPWAHPDIVEKTRELLEVPGARAAGLAAVRGMRLLPLEQGYEAMTVPTLIIVGREDRVTRLPAARLLSRRIPGSSLVEIPLCGHIPILEQPDKVLRALVPFLEAQGSLSPTTRGPDAGLTDGEPP